MKKLGIILLAIGIAASLVPWAAPSVRAEEPEISIKPATAVLETPLEGNMVEPEGTRQLKSGWQNIMTDGFEGAFPGSWVAGADSGYTDAYWGKDEYRHHTGSHSAFCAKSGTAGGNPPNNYPNNMSSWMIYGPFSLADATDAELNFWFRNKSQGPGDYVMWGASTDGCSFWGRGHDGDSGGWQSVSFDLTDVYHLGNLCGESQVWIAFIFESDESITDKGAFVDDVALRKYIGEPEPDIRLDKNHLDFELSLGASSTGHPGSSELSAHHQ